VYAVESSNEGRNKKDLQENMAVYVTVVIHPEGLAAERGAAASCI